MGWIKARPRLAAAAVAITVLFGLAANPAPAVAREQVSPTQFCAAQLQESLALQAKIQAHNARPHLFELPRQQAAYAAYNAEAAQLNGQRAGVEARLNACVKALELMAGPPGSNTLDVPLIPPGQQTTLQEALKNLPPTWKPATGPDANGYWRVPKGTPARPIFEVLRGGNPGNLGGTPLRGQSRPPVGARDPAYPGNSGRTIGQRKNGDPAVSPDHVIPLAEIINMPGFMKLTPANMYAVVRSPVNLQWLSWRANLSKSSRSVGRMSGLDPPWQSNQLLLEAELRKHLQEVIATLLKSQK